MRKILSGLLLAGMMSGAAFAQDVGRAILSVGEVTLVREGNNHYSGQVTFPRSGDWTFEVIVQLTDTDTVLLATTVPIP